MVILTPGKSGNAILLADLRAHGWNLSRVARRWGIPRSTLCGRVRRLWSREHARAVARGVAPKGRPVSVLTIATAVERRAAILRSLRQWGWNFREAAAELHTSRQSLYWLAQRICPREMLVAGQRKLIRLSPAVCKRLTRFVARLEKPERERPERNTRR